MNISWIAELFYWLSCLYQALYTVIGRTVRGTVGRTVRGRIVRWSIVRGRAVLTLSSFYILYTKSGTRV